jgi:hypothetical protein
LWGPKIGFTFAPESTKSEKEMKKMMKTVMTAYRVKVNRCCASCQHKECLNDGTRVCQKAGLKVEQKYCCSQWQMAAGLKNAGLQNGGVVRQRETKEIVIK